MNINIVKKFVVYQNVTHNVIACKKIKNNRRKCKRPNEMVDARKKIKNNRRKCKRPKRDG
jgi:hypothetical protein